jgi:hypothetical protein
MSHHATPHAEYPARLHVERSKEDVIGACKGASYVGVRVSLVGLIGLTGSGVGKMLVVVMSFGLR